MKIKNIILWIFIALLLAMGLKLWLIFGGWVPFNSDEAVVALMARHILRGERPVFFYGQAYMGSLDAFLVAAGFLIFGEYVWVIRIVQSLLYMGVLITTAFLGKSAFNSWRVGVLGTVLLAVPTVNLTLYTTASLGGYGEALLIGNLILLSGMRIAVIVREEHNPGSLWRWGALGLLSGLGLWAFGLTLIYSIPVVICLLISTLHSISKYRISNDRQLAGSDEIGEPLPTSRKFQRKILIPWVILLVGGVVGATPWWFYAIQHGFRNLFLELSGGAIAGVEGLPWALKIGRHAFNLLLLGSTVVFGLRPPWDIRWLALPLMPLVLVFWMAVVVFIFRSIRKGRPHQSSQLLLVGVMLALLAAFIFSPFGADPSGRYFLPLAVPLSIFVAAMILDLEKRVGIWAYGLVALLLIYNLVGTIQSALRYPPGISTQFYAPAQVDRRYDDELIEFLRKNNLTRGYGNYWVTYPLAFLSGEELIFVARLPYHLDFRYTERDNRYQPYSDLVEGAARIAYITTNHLDLNQNIRAGFSELGVTWHEEKIGDYTIFYELSRRVRPKELGLGETTFP